MGCGIGTVIGGIALGIILSLPGDTAVLSEAIPRPRDMTRLEERQYDRHCSGEDDPCKALKAAAVTAITEERGKMNNMLGDTKLYQFAYDAPNPALTGARTTWLNHAADLRGRINSIAAMISLGQKMGCDMSQEIALASTLLVPNRPN